MRITRLKRAATRLLPGMALLASVALMLASAPGFANIIQVAASASGPGGSQCSLIDAIKAANDNKKTGACPAGDDATDGGDIILLAAGTYKLTTADNNWFGPNGLPAITSKITLIGDPKGSIIMRDSSQGGSALRIFYIGGGESLNGYNPPTDSSGNPVFTALPGPGNLTLKNLTLENGLAQGGDGGKSASGNGGGGLGAGGAIYNQGTLTLDGVTLNGNQAIGGNGGGAASGSSSSGGNPGGGGGMSGKGDAFGNGGGFSGNGAWPDSSSAPGSFGNGGNTSNGGGAGGGGGAKKNGGFGGGGGGGGNGGFGGGAGFGGSAGFGGGAGGFDGGGAGLGGAIFNDGGSITILNCTLTANNAQGGVGGTAGVGTGSGFGGAIFNLNGSVTLRYSTLVGNTVTSNFDLLGSLFILGGGTTSTSAAGGAVYSLHLANPGSPAADAGSSASLNINSSILYSSNQVTLNSSGNTSAAANDCVNSGNFGGSNNDIGALSVTCLSGAQTAPAILLALGNNGGPTQTLQLLAVPPAFNGGDTTNAPELDQRGYLRDAAPDMGAFEYSSTRVAPPTVTGLQNATVFAASNAANYPFNISGSAQAPAGLSVSVNSSDTSLLPNANINLSSGCGVGTSQDTCTLSIKPPSDKIGSVVVTVVATGKYGQSGYASFTLNIIPPPPVASDSSLSTPSNQDMSGVMKATSAFISQLTYSIVTPPAHGTVKQSSNGGSAFTYTAESGYVGKDSFTFKVNDGSSDSNVATVTINVAAPIAIPGQLTAADQQITAYENTAYNGTLQILGGSGHGLSITIGSNPAHGKVQITDQNTGTFIYTPDSGYSGDDSFKYSAKDTLLNTTSNTATVSITVNAITSNGATAPVASRLALTTYAGIAVIGKLAASDAAGNPINYAATQPAHGTLKLDSASTGAFTYTPATGYIGADSFSFTATDTINNLISGPATVNVTINALPVSGKAVPLANDAAFTTYVNLPVKAALSASDAAGNALNYVLAQAPGHGTATITATSGAFVYTPNAGYTGADNFTFTASDASTGISSKAASVSLTVKALPPPAPVAPVANALSLATYQGVPVTGILTANDAAGNPVTYAITTPPAHSNPAISLAGATFTYTADAGFAGTDSFAFTATDSVTGLVSAPATVSFIVNTTPAAPAAPATSALTLKTYVNIPINGVLPASDALGSPLTYTVTQPVNGTVTVTAAGTFTYTPNAGYNGGDGFTYSVKNALTGATSVATNVNITVNLSPGTPGTPLASDGTVSLYENTSASGALIVVDDAGNALSYKITTQPAHGTVNASTTTGGYTYTPAIGYTGTDSFSFTVTDNVTNIVSNTGTVNLTINGVPPAPPAPLVSDASYSLYQDQTLTGSLSAAAYLGDPVSYSVIQPAHGTLNVTGSNFTYTPAAGYTGTDSFSFTAIDTAINTVSVSATISLIISSPSLAAAGPLANSAKLSLYAGSPISGVLMATDAAGNPLIYAAATQPAHGTLTINKTNGAFTYTPATGYTGNDSFTFAATDTVTQQVSTAATISFDISAVPATPPPVPPFTNNLSITSYSNRPLNAALSAAEAGTDALDFTITTQPAHGTLNITAASGAFTYTPATDYVGKDSFIYTATDIVTGAISATATVSIALLDASSVAGIAPLANGAALSLYANQPLSGTLSAVDAAGNPLNYVVSTQPAHGTLDITASSGAFTFTPSPGYTGNDSFMFTATDTVTQLASTAATVKLAINGAPLGNAPPLASDADMNLYAGQSLAGTLAAVDAAGNPLSYAVGTKPKNGTLSITAGSGAFVYTPTAGYIGSDSFTFTATDSVTKLASGAATVSLTINPAPPSPAHHGGPRGGGGLGVFSLLLLLPLAWRKRIKHIFRFGVLCCLLLTGSVALAQDTTVSAPLPPDSWYAGPQINLIKPDGKRNASSHGLRGWGLLLGREFGDYSLEFAAAYHADYPRGLTDNANWTSYGANGLWYFMHRDASWFTPFAYTGLGLARQYRGDNTHRSSAYLNLGIGFNSTFGQPMPVRLRVDLQVQHVFIGYNDVILNLGLMFPFGGSTPAWQQARPPTPSPLDEYPMSWCTEKGGEPHYTDKGWVCLPPAPASTTPPP